MRILEPPVDLGIQQVSGGRYRYCQVNAPSGERKAYRLVDVHERHSLLSIPTGPRPAPTS